MFTFQSLDADLADAGGLRRQPSLRPAPDYQSLTLDVGSDAMGVAQQQPPPVRGRLDRPPSVDKTDVELVAPQANLRRDATDFYDQTTAFTFSGMRACSGMCPHGSACSPSSGFVG